MSDLKKYISKRKASSPSFAEDFDEGYENFRIGVMLKQARLEAGLTQDEIANAIGTRKTAISRLENHVQDVKLSTVEKYAKALGKHVEIRIAWCLFDHLIDCLRSATEGDQWSFRAAPPYATNRARFFGNSTEPCVAWSDRLRSKWSSTKCRLRPIEIGETLRIPLILGSEAVNHSALIVHLRWHYVERSVRLFNSDWPARGKVIGLARPMQWNT